MTHITVNDAQCTFFNIYSLQYVPFFKNFSSVCTLSPPKHEYTQYSPIKRN
uniref:Uncharacterized protein n=1 Tax=Rhizophora mucronata TaxID=61149 RepID=A0A2P2PSK5_RHIMU